MCAPDRPASTTDFAFVALLTVLQEPICFLWCFERYVQGAIVLARSIRRVTNLDMILMLAGEARHGMRPATHQRLTSEGWRLCAVETVRPFAEAVRGLENTNRFVMADVYTKLAAWTLTNYKGVLLLDLDTLILRNPTAAFTTLLPLMLAENRTLGAVLDRPGGEEPLTHLSERLQSKCQKQWRRLRTFNAGTLLLVPSLATYTDLTRRLNSTLHDATLAEQGFLNTVFNQTFYELPFGYNGNMRAILCEPWLWANAQDVRVLHFNVEKPWNPFARWDLEDPHGLAPYFALWDAFYQP
jgi:hypothetical protein